MWSWKTKIPFNIRLVGGVVSLILATTNVVWSVVDGDFGNRFWLALFILVFFVGTGIDLYFERKRTRAGLTGELSDAR